jgi:hypothetical protein
VDPVVLAAAFLGVMAGAVACFVVAFARRKDRPAHVRWAVAGTVTDLLGTAVVVVTHRVLGWVVPARFPQVAAVHRVCAYAVTAWLVFQVAGGALRWRAHRASGPPFLALYVLTYGLAVWAYAPWW